MRALALLFLLLMVWVCPFPCSHTFDTETGLSLHQNMCEYVNAHNTDMDAALVLRTEQKRCKREWKEAESAATAAAATAATLHLNFDPEPDEPQSPGGAGIDQDVDMPDREPESTPPGEQTPPSLAGRPVRAKWLTWKLLQQVPPPPTEFKAPESEPETEEPAAPVASEYTWQAVKTVKNSFGMFYEYPSHPTHDPD
ncbi:hypothetical protein B0H14DRAFT_2611279 [Mycena olivaceomarginata]|nr:hypothetical protein B0H14DRAFT_2611279 [Mycena olivaceomarginata]